MKNTLRLLSIDFDFFEDIPDISVLSQFPDGIDLSSSLSTMVWSMHYAQNKQTNAMLRSIGIREEQFAHMLEILQQGIDDDCEILVANSHKLLYEWAEELVYDHCKDGIELTHIDMHHDVFDNGDSVDCGNWLKFLMDEIPTEVVWYENPITRKAYNCERLPFKSKGTDLKKLIGRQFDAVFLCRSDNWTPPHLDTRFDELLRELVRLGNVCAELNVQKPRDIEPLIEQERENRRVFNKMMKKEERK